MDWRGQRVLVTGGAGFVGSRIAHALISQGAQVRILDDLFTGLPSLLPQAAAFTRGSVTDVDLVRTLLTDVDYVFHLAVRNILVSTADPQGDLEVNVGGTLNVLSAARATDVRRVIYVSSASVYGAGTGQPSVESDVPHLLSPYATSKLSAEHYATLFHTVYGVPTTILRYSNVYGPGQSPSNPYCGVIGAFFGSCATGRKLRVCGDGQQTRDYTYVDDVVAATLGVAQCPGAVGETYNVGTGVETSVNCLAIMVQTAAGCLVGVEHVPARDVDTIHRRVMDARKLRDAIGWTSSTALAEGLAATYRWLRRQP